MDIVWFLLIGLAAGWLASQIMKGGSSSLVTDLIMGVIGSILGGLLFGLLGLAAGVVRGICEAIMTIDQVAEMLGVQPGLLQPFAVADPFHDGLPLEGFLCHKTDHRYGAVVITRVGKAPCPQLIHATPKLRYPFDRDGRFRFPPIARAHVYEKLDGTNVLAYRYSDAAGAVRTTFKLRLHPVLRNGTFGGFLDMWQELLERHPEAAALPARNGCSTSFELYGDPGRGPVVSSRQGGRDAALGTAVHEKRDAPRVRSPRRRDSVKRHFSGRARA